LLLMSSIQEHAVSVGYFRAGLIGIRQIWELNAYDR